MPDAVAEVAAQEVAVVESTAAAVTAEAAAENAVVAAQTAVAMTEAAAAVMAAQAAETIAEHQEEVRTVEERQAWLESQYQTFREEQNLLHQGIREEFRLMMAEMSTMREAIQRLTPSPQTPESESQTPPQSEGTVTIVEPSSPSSVDVVAQRAAEAPAENKPKRTKRYL